MSPPITFAQKQIIQIAIAALLLIGCIAVLMPFTGTLLLAVIICVTTTPMHRLLLARCGARSTLTASRTTVWSGPAPVCGISIWRPSCRPAARKQAWNPPSRIVLATSATWVLRRMSTPMSLIRPISALSFSRGMRYFGMP